MSLDNTIGAVFIGTIISSILYGFTCVQTWYYFTHYPKDRWYIKILVAFVLVSDSIHEILIVHMVYVYVIANFGVDAELTRVVWSLDVEVMFNGFTTLAVQCFLAMRVWKLSNKNWIATGLVMVFVLGEFITSFMFSIMSLPLVTFQQFASLNALSMTINAFSAVGDLIITLLLCYLLHSARTGFDRSGSIITKLIVFTVNTGLLTSLCAWGSLISITVWSHAWIYIGFYFCIGRLYCNTLLGTLNARKGLRNGGISERSDDMSLTNRDQGLQKTGGSFFGTGSKHMPNNISVKIDTTHEYVRDEYGDQYSSSNTDVKKVEVV